MTRPTLPGLVAEWMKPSRLGLCGESHYMLGYDDAQRDCAAELSQAVALSPAEREAVAQLLVQAQVSQQTGSDFVTVMTRQALELNTLLARLTAASDGGGKGEEA